MTSYFLMKKEIAYSTHPNFLIKTFKGQKKKNKIRFDLIWEELKMKPQLDFIWSKREETNLRFKGNSAAEADKAMEAI